MSSNHHLPNFLSFSLLFFCIGCMDLAAVVYCPPVRWVSKPLILISLLFYYFYSSKSSSSFSLWFFLGLIAALLGDVLLLFPNKNYFLFGLSSFLVMQLLYIFSFFQNSFCSYSKKWMLSFLLLAVLGYYMYTLWPHLDYMRIPVLIYSLIIVIMSISAMMRDSKIPGFGWVVVGSILFMISDGFIAWNKFGIFSSRGIGI